jgi:hypothetical protein
MRIALQTLLVFAAVAFGLAAEATVIITELPEPVLVYDDFLGMFYPIDIDGDQSADFTFMAGPTRASRGRPSPQP